MKGCLQDHDMFYYAIGLASHNSLPNEAPVCPFVINDFDVINYT